MKFEFIINCYPQVFVFVCVFYNVVVKYHDVVWVFGWVKVYEFCFGNIKFKFIILKPFFNL